MSWRSSKPLRRTGIRAALAVLALFLLWCGWGIWRSYHDPQAVTREISAGLAAPVRLAVLSDLHDHTFGADNAPLVELVAEQEPDLILLDGDMLNADSPDSRTVLSLCAALAEIAPVYYAWGNHELAYLAAGTSDLEGELEALGVTVLEEDYVDLTVRSADLRLGGLYGYAFSLGVYNSCEREDMDPEVWDFLTEFQDTDRYKLLLCHRPDSFIFGAASRTWDVDLVISGHNHGGQVVLPLLGGVFGGDQGLFPTYIHGVYRKDRITLAVTSGLSSQPERLPRFRNPPEVLILDLTA